MPEKKIKMKIKCAIKMVMISKIRVLNDDVIIHNVLVKMFAYGNLSFIQRTVFELQIQLEIMLSQN